MPIYDIVFVWAFFYADFHGLHTKINTEKLPFLCSQRIHFPKSNLVTQPVEVKKKKKKNQFCDKFYKPVELTKLIGCVTELGQ